MTESSTSSQLVEQAISGLRENDDSKLADALEGLVANEPVRWRQLLLLSGLWPEPSRQKLNADSTELTKTLSCLMKAMQSLLERDVDTVEIVQEMMLTLQGFFTLQAYYTDIVQELEKLQFVNLPPEVQVHRLVAFVEGESRTIEKKLAELHESVDYYDPLAGHASTIPTRYDGSKASLGEAFDSLCETVELCLRLVFHSHSLPTTPAFQPTLGPYNDPDIEKYAVLAGIWRQVTEAWSNIRYRGWRWTLDGDGNRACLPVDNAAYVREHAGSIRYQLFIGDRISTLR